MPYSFIRSTINMNYNIFSIHGKDYRQLSPFLLRLIIGFGFMAHGWAKLAKGPDAFAKLLEQVHVPFPHLMAWLSVATELLGGLAIFIGVLTSLAAIPLIGTMVVALFTVNIHYGFSSIKTIGLTPQGPVFGPPGYEINLLYIAGLLTLILMGAGQYSIDALLAKRQKI